MFGAMDLTALALFAVATFVGGIATGLAGFAFGLVVSGVWLHVLAPAQVAMLIVSYGVFVQSYGIWKLRRAFNWRYAVPLALGSAAGAPAGVWLLHFVDPGYLRLGVGVLLVAYSLNGLLRPHLKAIPANLPAELGVGLFNGVLGGMTGLAGVFVTVWCGMRGWNKDEQRAVYQPVILATFAISAASLIYRGAMTAATFRLFLLGAVPLLAGMLFGMKLYDRLDDAAFRKVILVVLLISGTVLVVPELIASV